MQTLVVFGGTGNTGLCVVRYALQINLMVRLFARPTSIIPDDIKDKVELYIGDVVNYDDVEKAVNGSDLVVCTLGTRGNLAPSTMMSTGTQNIVNAMEKFDIKKGSFCLSSFMFWDPAKVPAMFKETHKEHTKMMEILKASDADYRAICPPNISNDPADGFEVAFDKTPGSRYISKFNLGQFMVDSLMDNKYDRKVIGISNKS